MNYIDYNNKLESYQRVFIIKILETITDYPFTLNFINFEQDCFIDKDIIFEILGVKKFSNKSKDLNDYKIQIDKLKKKDLINFLRQPNYLFSCIERIIILDKTNEIIFETYDYFSVVSTRNDFLKYTPPIYIP